MMVGGELKTVGQMEEEKPTGEIKINTKFYLGSPKGKALWEI